MRKICMCLGLAAAFLVLAVPAPARAQGSATSSITGVVVDAEGGFVPGASVKIKNDSTGAELSAVSGANGVFTVPSVNVGKYTVTVSLQGFKQAVLKEIVVTAGVPATVRAVLEVGGLTEQVVVTGGTEVVQTQSAAASTTINTKSITSLPVGSRSALDFTQFLPGVQTASSVRNSTVNGLPQSSISITLDGVNIQDNTLKTTDGFFAIVSPRLDAIEQVTMTSAAQGAEATGQGGVQIQFTTRSGGNSYNGSAYHFYQSDRFNTNTYANIARGLPKGPLTLHQPGVRQGGPVVIPGVYDGRGKMFFFVNFEATHNPSTITTNSNLLLPAAQNGLFKWNGSAEGAAGVNLYALAAANGQTSTPDPVVAALLQQIRTATTTTGVLSAITGNLNAERFSFQQKVSGPVYYPTFRVDYNLSSMHRLSGTWYRQKFTDKGFDTTNTRQPLWPGFEQYGTQGSLREAYTASLRSTVNQNIVNEVRVANSGAPVFFGPYYGPQMFTNQAGFSLGISAAGISNAGPTQTPSGRNATTLNVADTVNWLKGSHSIGFGTEFGQYDVWLDTYGTRSVPSIGFGTSTGDPALGMFSAANFPGSTSDDRNAAAALYGVLTGRVNSIGATARIDASTGQYVYQGDSTAKGRLRQFDFFLQDNWRWKPNVSLNLGLRYALQTPFAAGNSSYSTATLDDLWGISGYLPGCNLSDPTRDTCNLFKPGTMTGSKPTYQNLGKGVKAYEMDRNNIAPSIGINWTPAAESGWLRRLLGGRGDTSLSAGYSRAFDRRGMNDFTGVFGNNPGLSITATRNRANGNLTLPLLFRSGASALGPPPLCPPLPAAKPTGCLLAAPEYPLSNQNASGSVNIFDPNLQIPYSDTYTVGIQRSVGRGQAIEVRYVGTRSRQQWENFNYNEANIHENNFLNEFRLAQANLQSHIAAGCGTTANPCSFAYRGPGTNTSPLPIYLAFFTGTLISQQGLCGGAGQPTCTAMYSGNNWTNSNFVNPLGIHTSNPFTPAGTGSNGGLAGDPVRQANSIAAGLPANFFRVNPDMLGGANATGNRGFSKYNSIQLQYRRRLSGGLQFDANYTFGKEYESDHFSFRVPRLFTRVTGQEGDVTHGVKATGVYELPFGRGRKFGGSISALLDHFIGNWQVSGTSRIQTGRLFDLGNVRVVGMTKDEVQDLFKLRFTDDKTIVYAWPQSVIDETIKAYSLSATSASGYGSLGPPSGKYFAPSATGGCVETINGDYGECGVRSLVITGPMLLNFDLSLRKRVKLSGRMQYELSLDFFNILNRVNWTPSLGIGNTTLADWQSGLPNAARTMQIGTRFTW